MPNEFKNSFIENLKNRYGELKKLPNGASLYEIINGDFRIYIRYSKVHYRSKNYCFYGLKKDDLKHLDNFNSAICFLWDTQKEPLFLPYSEFRGFLSSIQPAPDGQIKTSIFLENDNMELSISTMPKINIDEYYGWAYLEKIIEIGKSVGILDAVSQRLEIREIEIEKEDSTEELFNVFDPKDVDIAVETRSLDSLISRIKEGSIDMNTYFQRKGDLWPNITMSRLIESILIRFPIPAFYFDASDDDHWLIVDGLQRLSAIKKFVLNTDLDYVKKNYNNEDISNERHKPLKLKGLEYLQYFNNMTYLELPNNMKRRLKDAQIITYLVKPGTPEGVIYSIFYRINTGGVTLNKQEIRHVLNQKGKSPKFLEELAESEIFKKTLNISDKRMQDRELILRYIAFRLTDYEKYIPPMFQFLNDAMKNINELDIKYLSELKNGFNRSLEVCTLLFGNVLFSKSIFFIDDKSTLNRALFEIWTVTISKLDQNKIEKLISNKHNVITDFKELFKNNDFDNSISVSTTGHPQVQLRFKSIEKIVQKYT